MVFSLYLPLTNGHPSNAASGHCFGVPRGLKTPQQWPPNGGKLRTKLCGQEVWRGDVTRRRCREGLGSVVAPRTKTGRVGGVERVFGSGVAPRTEGPRRRC